MKHLLALVAYFLICATGKTIAQVIIAPSEPQKELLKINDFSNVDYLQTKVFTFYFGEGCYLQITNSYQRDFEKFQNIDSLIKIIKNDVFLFKDSLADPINGKRLEILIMPDGSRRVAIRNTPPQHTLFIVNKKEDAAILKTLQDTASLVIPLIDAKWTKSTPDVSKKRYLNIRFVLNDINNINIDGQPIDSIQSIVQEGNTEKTKKNKEIFGFGTYNVAGNGYTNSGKFQKNNSSLDDWTLGDMTLRLQNYKNYLSSSITIGTSYVIHYNGETNPSFLHIGLEWEPTFFFQKNVDNKLQTFRNDFLNFRIVQEKSEAKKTIINTDVSFGYLIRRKGDFIDKNTFKFSFGSLQYKNFSLQPQFFFHNFFKAVTPSFGLRYSL